MFAEFGKFERGDDDDKKYLACIIECMGVRLAG